jgi:hypothetical protein
MKRSFTGSPSVALGKKRGGPSHRVRKDDGYPLPNDWVEAVIVFIALVGVFGGAYGLYALSQVS